MMAAVAYIKIVMIVFMAVPLLKYLAMTGNKGLRHIRCVRKPLQVLQDPAGVMGKRLRYQGRLKNPVYKGALLRWKCCVLAFCL